MFPLCQRHWNIWRGNILLLLSRKTNLIIDTPLFFNLNSEFVTKTETKVIIAELSGLYLPNDKYVARRDVKVGILSSQEKCLLKWMFSSRKGT